MVDENPITCMSSDEKSRTLAVGNSNGYIVILSCDNQTEWKPLYNIAPLNEIPVISLGTLNRGENLFIAGLSNG